MSERTCAECGVVLLTDSHRFYEPDDAGREQLRAQYCSFCCPRCFREDKTAVGR